MRRPAKRAAFAARQRLLRQDNRIHRAYLGQKGYVGVARRLRLTSKDGIEILGGPGALFII
jgi:hypothetical protein